MRLLDRLGQQVSERIEFHSFRLATEIEWEVAMQMATCSYGMVPSLLLLVSCEAPDPSDPKLVNVVVVPSPSDLDDEGVDRVVYEAVTRLAEMRSKALHPATGVNKYGGGLGPSLVWPDR